MAEVRLGDDIDDFCIKCKRPSNHLVVSLMNGAAAKVRCRSCYSEHDFRNLQAPPTKKELKKQAMLAAEAASAEKSAEPQS
jgi:DNA-directed RNA polymerase subunit M/transcription elongation factor TFIIS